MRGKARVAASRGFASPNYLASLRWVCFAKIVVAVPVGLFCIHCSVALGLFRQNRAPSRGSVSPKFLAPGARKPVCILLGINTTKSGFRPDLAASIFWAALWQLPVVTGEWTRSPGIVTDRNWSVNETGEVRSGQALARATCGVIAI